MNTDVTGPRSRSKIWACILLTISAGSPSVGTSTADSQTGQPPGWVDSPVSHRKFGPGPIHRPSSPAAAASAPARSSRAP